jgi:hypothetical protein
LEEIDPLPNINETLAPSSTQNLLADKLEIDRGLWKWGNSVEGEGGFHFGASSNLDLEAIKVSDLCWVTWRRRSGGDAGFLPATRSAQVDEEPAKGLQQDYNFSSVLNITLEARAWHWASNQFASVVFISVVPEYTCLNSYSILLLTSPTVTLPPTLSLLLSLSRCLPFNKG